MLLFVEGGGRKTRGPGEKASEQGRGTNMNSTQMASSLYPETMNKEDN